MAFVTRWTEATGIPVKRFLKWLDISPGKYHSWKSRQGEGNRHNGQQSRRAWLLDWERDAIVTFAIEHPGNGYRRLTYMMLDADVVAVSPSSVYRVLKAKGMLQCQTAAANSKGDGFQQPQRPHEHWHIDVSYINIAGTFYYLCTVLDGYSRFIVHWEIREQMREDDVEIILQRAQEHCPGASPRIISDNGPQFIARDFKVFIREMGMTHVRTSPYYPQSNGKLERWHKTLKAECIRPQCPVSLDDARSLVQSYVGEYNDVRLHSAIGYITPKDKLEGRADIISAERRDKLSVAAKARAEAYEQQQRMKAA